MLPVKIKILVYRDEEGQIETQATSSDKAHELLKSLIAAKNFLIVGETEIEAKLDILRNHIEYEGKTYTLH